MNRNCGIFFKKNEGWRAELTICNGDRFYTSYFKEYKEAALEYNRVLKELKENYGLRNMFRWGLPTKSVPLKIKIDINHKNLKKKTRSGKYY